MSFTRKMKRRNKLHNGNHSWVHKSGYDTETHEFWFCENCGKEKWIEKEDKHEQEILHRS